MEQYLSQSAWYLINQYRIATPPILLSLHIFMKPRVSTSDQI